MHPAAHRHRGAAARGLASSRYNCGKWSKLTMGREAKHGSWLEARNRFAGFLPDLRPRRSPAPGPFLKLAAENWDILKQDRAGLRI